MHGHFDASHPKPTIDHFLVHFRKLEKANKELLGSQQDPKKKEDLTKTVNHFKGMLVRQISTGIYKEPHPLYLKKLNQGKGVARELSSYTGKQV